MSALPFTDRELKKAWRELSAAAEVPHGRARQNAHRLLLFYAVECGLKAAWLKRQGRTVFSPEDISRTGHNLHKLLKELCASAELALNMPLKLSDVTGNQSARQRTCGFSELHQVWRYGGQCQTPTDQDCEQQLQKVLQWIRGELK